MPVSDAATIRVVDATALTPGSDFGTRYRIEALLGQGGMGRVYKALDKTLDRIVALKVVRQGMMGDAEALKRFKQELLLASKISHKNILRIHDMGEVGDIKFITMAFVEGQDLHQILHKTPKLPMERALSFCGDSRKLSRPRTRKAWSIATSSRRTFLSPAMTISTSPTSASRSRLKTTPRSA